MISMSLSISIISIRTANVLGPRRLPEVMEGREGTEKLDSDRFPDDAKGP